jgi:hypothetical protein
MFLVKAGPTYYSLLRNVHVVSYLFNGYLEANKPESRANAKVKNVWSSTSNPAYSCIVCKDNPIVTVVLLLIAVTIA